jgi:hypothetical protein
MLLKDQVRDLAAAALRLFMERRAADEGERER